MINNRRDFLKTGSSLIAGLALAPLACKSKPKEKDIETGKELTETGKELTSFGLQLYTLRDELPKDPKGILRQVASFGYKQIEGYEGPMGIFWGMSNTDFKKYMDDLGMNFIASHCDVTMDFEKKAADTAAIGMKYLMFPWEGAGKTIDDYKKYAEDFNKKGEICKKNGIRFAFHNHDFSFIPINGVFPQDVLMQNTDPSLVDFEMDMYWVVTAGQDIETWLKKYKDRFRLCHIKDRSKTPVEDNGKNSVNLGTGSIDFTKALKTAKENGVEYYIVEQEAYEGTTPLKAAEADAEYMKKVKI